MSAPHLIAEDPDDVFDWATDWRELAGEPRPGGGDVFSFDRAEASLVGVIPANKKRSAARKILGRSRAYEGPPYKLFREQPVAHPEYPFLRAASVTFEDFGLCGNPDYPRDDPEPWEGTMYAKRPAADAGKITEYTNYRLSKATIRFTALPYEVFDDDDWKFDGVSEWTRNTQIFESTDPSLQLLLADGGSPFMAWSETWAADATRTPKKPAGPSLAGMAAAINIALPEYLTQCDFVLAWMNVAKEFVTRDNVPVRLLNALGSVNKSDWLEFPAGTLLCQSARVQYFQYPYWYDSVAIGCNVFIGMKWFDPPRGALAPQKRGHQVLPYSRSGLYASCVRQVLDGAAPDAANPPLFRETDFAGMFGHAWQDIGAGSIEELDTAGEYGFGEGE